MPLKYSMHRKVIFFLMKTAIFILLPVLQSIEVHLQAPCLAAEGITRPQDTNGFVAGLWRKRWNDGCELQWSFRESHCRLIISMGQNMVRASSLSKHSARVDDLHRSITQGQTPSTSEQGACVLYVPVSSGEPRPATPVFCRTRFRRQRRGSPASKWRLIHQEGGNTFY